MTKRRSPDGAANMALAVLNGKQATKLPALNGRQGTNSSISDRARLQRTTISAPASAMRDARKLAADLDVNLNDVFLLGLNGALGRSGYDLVPGLDPNLEGRLDAVRSANSSRSIHRSAENDGTSPPVAAI